MVLPDDCVLVIDSSHAELWDPGTESFRPVGPLPQERQDHVAVLLSDGRVLLLGGYDPESGTFPESALLWGP